MNKNTHVMYWVGFTVTFFLYQLYAHYKYNKLLKKCDDLFNILNDDAQDRYKDKYEN